MIRHMVEHNEIISKIDQVSNALSELENSLKRKARSGLKEFDIIPDRENYDEVVRKLNIILSKLKRGIEKNYVLPVPSLPDTAHWEIANEFINYFQKSNRIKSIKPETPPGFRSKKRADLFIETPDDTWYWVEIQTTLQNEEIMKKIDDSTTISKDDRYAEYVLIFPKEFEKESLFMTTMMVAKGNTKTDKLRVMLYSDGKFETVLYPKDQRSW